MLGKNKDSFGILIEFLKDYCCPFSHFLVIFFLMVPQIFIKSTFILIQTVKVYMLNLLSIDRNGKKTQSLIYVGRVKMQ